MPAIGRKKVVLYPLPSAADLLGPNHLPTKADLSVPLNDVRDDDDNKDKVNGEPSSSPSSSAKQKIIDDTTPLKDVRERHLREHVRKLNAQRQETSSSTLGKNKKAAAAAWEEPEVYLVEETGEVFLEYEEYVNRIMFLKKNVFSCEATGASDLHYGRALESEYDSKIDTWLKVSPGMRAPVLRSCQFIVEGQLNDLVDRVLSRFQNRYFPLDRVLVDVGDEKLVGVVIEVIEPGKEPQENSVDDDPLSYHVRGTNLGIPEADADEQDPADAYRYGISLVNKTLQTTLTDEPWQLDAESRARWASKDWALPRLTVHASELHRDRMSYNKVTFRRFLRDWLDRDTAQYSPWFVQPYIAAQFGISAEMSSDVQRNIEHNRERALDKRRRPRASAAAPPEEEEEAAKPSKKAKREQDPDAISKGKARYARAKAKKLEEERLRKEQEEKERLEAEKRKRKATRFPAEDLMVELNDREKADGKPIVKPAFSKSLPFAEHFETFLSTWSFLNVASSPLALSPFTLDEYENALYHNDPFTPCTLTTEIHAALLTAIADDVRKAQEPPTYPLKAFGPMEEMSSDHESSEELSDEEEEQEKEEKFALMVDAATAHAEKWEGRDLLPKDGRKGWEMSLIGCLFQRSTEITVPNLRHYLQHLLFEDDSRAKNTNGRPSWATTRTRPKLTKRVDEKYITLDPVYKLEIVIFLCELACQTKLIRDYYEDAANALTKCRNDMNEVRREIKLVRDERQALEPKEEAAAEVIAETNGHAPSRMGSPLEQDELEVDSGHSDGSLSERSEPANGGGGGAHASAAARQKALLEKQAQRKTEEDNRAAELAKNRAEQAAKRKEKETLNEQKRRLDSEVERLELEAERLEREFRKHYNAFRPTPFGQDRYGNRYWWLDGSGTADLLGPNGQVVYGTGRVFVQGALATDLEQFIEKHELDTSEIETRRDVEEPAEVRLREDEWAVIDSVDMLHRLMEWLNPKGHREVKLLQFIQRWSYALEGGMLQREQLFAEAAADELNGDDDRSFLGRRVKRQGASKEQYKGKQAYLGYKNTLK